jgi:hypothetical protein
MDPIVPSEPGQTPPDQEFKPKPIDQPFVDPSLKQKLMRSQNAGPSKSFYQANKIYVWAIVAGLAIIGVLAFFALRKTPVQQSKDANVDISFDAPDTVASGGEEVYKIKVQNNDKQKLANMQLELAYPEGVTFISSSPDPGNISGTLFAVPDLIPGQNVTIFVKTKVTGDINQQKQVTAKLHYKYDNSSLAFTKEQAFAVRIAASDMALEIDGPATANNAELVVYTIKYKNNSPDTINNGRIQANFPQGFDFAQSQPLPDMGNNIWNVGNLAAGQNGTITVQGSFRSANPGESKTAEIEFQVLGQDGKYYLQANAQFTTALSALPLLASQELQNGNNANTVNPGDQLTFNIKYQNNAATAATGVNIIVTLNSKVLDLSTLQAESGDINNNTIIWNASNVPNLATLNPSDAGQLSFSVTVKKPATRDSSKSLTVVSDIKIKSNEYSTFLPGNQLTLKVTSPLTLESKLDYVSGSLPPQVGKATVYKVSLSLKNEANDYSNGSVTVSLPGNDYVPGSANAQESSKVSYDQATGILTWNFGNLPAHTGVFSQARTLQFNVKISPSSSQANQAPTLAKNIQLSAQDLFTNQTVTAGAEDITTNDISGQGWNNGQVQP